MDLKLGIDTLYQSSPFITFKNVTQKFGEFVLFDNLCFSMEDTEKEGEIIALMGESGCGKSSILRIIAGIQRPDSGEVFINGKVQDLELRIPMVFQHYVNFEHLSVLDNIVLPLKWAGVSKQDRYKKGMNMIRLLGLEGHQYKYAQYPRLSGGQLQRVAIGRSLINNPNMLLMDEPFGALDTKTRFELYSLMFSLKDKVKPKIIFVTHNTTEAVYLADKVYIMSANPGKIDKMINLNLPEIRTPDLQYSPHFMSYVKQIDKHIKTI